MSLEALEALGVKKKDDLYLVPFDWVTHEHFVPDIRDLDEELYFDSIRMEPLQPADEPSDERISDQRYMELVQKNGTRVFIGIEKNKVAGLIVASPNFDVYKETVTIESFIVAKEFRGKRRGEELLEMFYSIVNDHFKEKVSNVVLRVLDKNVAAKKVYKKSGFKPMSHSLYKKL